MVIIKDDFPLWEVHIKKKKSQGKFFWSDSRTGAKSGEVFFFCDGRTADKKRSKNFVLGSPELRYFSSVQLNMFF